MNGLRSGSVMARPGEGLAAIPLETRQFEDLGRYLREPMMQWVRVAQQHAGELLAGRTVWMVNSTALSVTSTGEREPLMASSASVFATW
jgi:hypothetical protein